MRHNQKVCFIGGAGHSGSTLLGLMIGSHSTAFYAGEAKKSIFIGNPRKPLRKRVCKLCGEACSIWGSFVFPSDGDLYEEVSRRSARALVVDSTKKRAWVEERLAAMPAGVAVHHIFLSRDGRAVVSSRARKYPDVDVRVHVEEWMEQIAATQDLRRNFPGPTLALRYEELCQDPDAAMVRVAQFLGIDVEPEMLSPWDHPHHPLGGNSGTQWLLAREQRGDSQGVVELGDRTRAYYGAHAPEIKLDLRWQHEMSVDARALFDELAGETNAPFAWEPSAR